MSGTTRWAAERTIRRSVGLEICPAYVDVTIRRWHELSGLEAIHDASGETYALVVGPIYGQDLGLSGISSFSRLSSLWIEAA